MSEQTGEKAVPRVRKWRDRSNHSVTRVMPNRAESLPCFCWATEDHALGDELRIPPKERS